MYAIIRTGSKQYKVQEGDEIDVELLKTAEGNSVEFDEVLLFNDGTNVKVGTPHVNGMLVEGEVVGTTKGPKVIAFKYIRRKATSKKIGHRQKYLRVKIKKIKGAK